MNGTARVYGIDFTSAPSRRKPIACAACLLEGQVLYVDGFFGLERLEMFENLLESAGPWTAGLDFPFGQPRRLVEDLGWPASWAGYVGHAGEMRMAEFTALLRAYCARREPGQKYLLRQVDRAAGARSPMMLYGVPVGRMFLRGAPRLLRARASVLPCRPLPATRVALECYPALAARRWCGGRPYKAAAQSRYDAARRAARAAILAGLASPAAQAAYGLRCVLPASMADDLLAEPGGDQLDALLCALQAAWGERRRDAGYGIPASADPLEGWIVDPALARGDTHSNTGE